MGGLEEILVQQVAGYLWRQRRAQRQETGAIRRHLEERRDEEALRNHARFLDTLAAGENLEQSVRGIQHLLDQLTAIIDQVQQGVWSVDACTLLRDHFRTHIRLHVGLEKPTDSLPEDVDRTQLLKQLRGQRARLQKRLPEVVATEQREGEAKVRSYMLPVGPELDLVLRYEAALDRKLHKAMDQLRKIQADRQAVARGDAGGDPPPAG